MRTIASHVLLVCLAASTLLVAGRAQGGSAEDEARKLFEDGIAAEKAGRAAEACAKFRQSLGLVREVGPLLKVKGCAVQEGKLVAAEASLKELIDRWPSPGPELDALKREQAEIAARIPRLSVSARKDAPPGMAVRLDGAPLALPATDLAVDPGDHELSIELPARPTERLPLKLAQGEKKAVELPPAPVGMATKPPPPPETSAGLGPLGITGIIVGVVGVGGFIGAGVTGKLVLDKQTEFEDAHCGPDDPQPDAASCATLASDGDSLLIANGVLWGVGIAGVAVGATLLIVDLVTPSNEPGAAKASLGAGPGHAELTIRF